MEVEFRASSPCWLLPKQLIWAVVGVRMQVKASPVQMYLVLGGMVGCCSLRKEVGAGEEGGRGEWGKKVVGLAKAGVNIGRAMIEGLEPNLKYKLQTLKKPPIARK